MPTIVYLLRRLDLTHVPCGVPPEVFLQYEECFLSDMSFLLKALLVREEPYILRLRTVVGVKDLTMDFIRKQENQEGMNGQMSHVGSASVRVTLRAVRGTSRTSHCLRVQLNQ